jgi:hypothetical protein
MSDPIFLVSKEGTLIAMNEAPYDKEDDLQKLLAQHPQLVYSVSESIPELLLVAREAGVPGDEDEYDSFSLDHLFLDKDGVPTLVEVKRSSDTRIRREVIGQMLDYAANASIYWTVETIRGMFVSNWETSGHNPEAVLSEFINEEMEPEEFWNRVKTNLQAGKIRLVFAADTIPRRMKRVVEFLNEQMDPCEVLALEIHQFIGEGGLQMIAPRIVGQTAKTITKSRIIDKKKWNEEDFLIEMRRKFGDDSVKIVKQLLSWAMSNKIRLWWGEGKNVGSCYPVIDFPEGTRQIFSIWTDGRIGLELKKLTNYSQIGTEKTLTFLHMINKINGVSINDRAITGYPTIPIIQLKDEDSYKKFITAVDWIYYEIKK